MQVYPMCVEGKEKRFSWDGRKYPMPSASFSKKVNKRLVLSQLYRRERTLGLECHKQDDASAN